MRLLLGAAPDAPGAAIARLGGIGLIAFGLATWPQEGGPSPAARRAMLVLQPAMAIGLALIALGPGLAGPLLWPAVAWHVAAALVLARG